MHLPDIGCSLSITLQSIYGSSLLTQEAFAECLLRASTAGGVGLGGEWADLCRGSCSWQRAMAAVLSRDCHKSHLHSIFQQKIEIQITSWIFSHQESERVTDMTTVFSDQPCSRFRLYVTELENDAQRRGVVGPRSHSLCVWGIFQTQSLAVLIFPGLSSRGQGFIRAPTLKLSFKWMNSPEHGFVLHQPLPSEVDYTDPIWSVTAPRSNWGHSGILVGVSFNTSRHYATETLKISFSSFYSKLRRAKRLLDTCH